MPEATRIESGRAGRTLYVRVGPNEDLVGALQELCAEQGVRHAFVRGGVGSVVDACLRQADGRTLDVPGPAVEILSLAGEIRSGAQGAPAASLSGMVLDPRGEVRGGAFEPGANLVFATFEVTLEEWLPDPT